MVVGGGLPLGVVFVPYAVSCFFVGPFAAALFTTRAQWAPEVVRTEVFTVAAGLKMAASAAGAALIGLVAGLSLSAQFPFVGISSILPGLIGSGGLVARRRGG